MTVSTYGRLHLGFLDLNGDLGRRFGSIGVSIDAFDTRVRVEAATQTEVCGVQADRALSLVQNIREQLQGCPPIKVDIIRALPPHAGLGSGTQLALALAHAITTLVGEPVDAAGLAQLTGRGRRSGIGIGAFESGGFVLDGGHGAATSVPPVLARLTFPENWRFILVTDSSEQGLNGRRESAAFKTLRPASAEVAAHICRITLMQMLPGIVDEDFAAVSKSLRIIQDATGDYFAPSQGGRYASREVESVLLTLEEAGIEGIGQTSWGPTGFALIDNEHTAMQLVSDLQAKLDLPETIQLHVARAVNEGAQLVRTQESADVAVPLAEQA